MKGSVTAHHCSTPGADGPAAAMPARASPSARHSIARAAAARAPRGDAIWERRPLHGLLLRWAIGSIEEARERVWQGTSWPMPSRQARARGGGRLPASGLKGTSGPPESPNELCGACERQLTRNSRAARACCWLACAPPTWKGWDCPRVRAEGCFGGGDCAGSVRLRLLWRGRPAEVCGKGLGGPPYIRRFMVPVGAPTGQLQDHLPPCD